jgi:hypothetical protein
LRVINLFEVRIESIFPSCIFLISLIFSEISDHSLFFYKLDIQKMEYNRRSVRNVSSCLQSTNIFNSEVGDRHLRENIPEGILQKVGKTKTTSCSIIAQLAPFEMVDEEEEEFQRCIRAMEYQLTWQSELLWPIC